jgi:FkbM family methyltransferase
VTGRLPEMTWGELWGYAADRSGDAETSGFVRRVRHTGEEPCTTLWRTPLGDLWGRATDEDLLEFLVIEQLIERVYDHGRAGVREGDTVLDVGGHLGVFTRFALERGAGRVVVFEPEAVNLACLEKTFADEIEAERVILVAAAAWHSRTVLTFKVPRETNTGEGRVSDDPTLAGEDFVEVPAVTIDEVVRELGLERVDFVKMDIEGAERHALAGAKETLGRFAPRMALCVYHLPDDREVLSRIARDARPGYRVEGDRQHAFFY